MIVENFQKLDTFPFSSESMCFSQELLLAIRIVFYGLQPVELDFVLLKQGSTPGTISFLCITSYSFALLDPPRPFHLTGR